MTARPTIVAANTRGEFCTRCGQTGALRTTMHEAGCPIPPAGRARLALHVELGTRAAMALRDADRSTREVLT